MASKSYVDKLAQELDEKLEEESKRTGISKAELIKQYLESFALHDDTADDTKSTTTNP
jgi:predicted DNA-binding protein